MNKAVKGWMCAGLLALVLITWWIIETKRRERRRAAFDEVFQEHLRADNYRGFRELHFYNKIDKGGGYNYEKRPPKGSMYGKVLLLEVAGTDEMQDGIPALDKFQVKVSSRFLRMSEELRPTAPEDVDTVLIVGGEKKNMVGISRVLWPKEKEFCRPEGWKMTNEEFKNLLGSLPEKRTTHPLLYSQPEYYATQYADILEETANLTDPYRVGKVVIIWARDRSKVRGGEPRFHWSHYDLPDNLRADHPDEVGTIVGIRTTSSPAGAYGAPASAGGFAVSNYSEYVSVVDRKKRMLTVKERRLYNYSPPPSVPAKQVHGMLIPENDGKGKGRDIVEFLRSLPLKE